MEDQRASFILQAGKGRAMHTGVDRVLKIDARQTDGRLSIADATHKTGFSTNVHRHTRHDEIFYVLSGSYTFRVGGSETRLAAGGFVFIPTGTAHGFTCEADGSMLVMFSPGDGEDYFTELAEILEAGINIPENVTALQAKYGMEIVVPSRRNI